MTDNLQSHAAVMAAIQGAGAICIIPGGIEQVPLPSGELVQRLIAMGAKQFIFLSESNLWYAFGPEFGTHWLSEYEPVATQSPAEVAPENWAFYLDRNDAFVPIGVQPDFAPPPAQSGFHWWYSAVLPESWFQTIAATSQLTGRAVTASAVSTQATAPAPKPTNKVADWLNSLPHRVWAWLGKKYGGWRYLIMIGLVGIIILCLWILLTGASPTPSPATGSMAPDGGAIATAMANPLSLEEQAVQVCGAGAIPLNYAWEDEQKNTHIGVEKGFLPTPGTVYYVFSPDGFVQLVTGNMDTLESLAGFDVDKGDKWDVNSGPYLWRKIALNWGSNTVNNFANAKDEANYVKDVPRAVYRSLIAYLASPTQCVMIIPPLSDIPNSPQSEIDRMREEGTPPPADPLPTQPPKSEGSATPAPDVAISNRPAFEKYAAIVGEDAAKAAFTANPGTQCYTTISVSWNDFITTTPMTEVLRILGPSGFLVREGGNLISYDRDQNGFVACVTVSDLVTSYPQGTWNIGLQSNAMLRWSKISVDPQEIAVGENQIGLWPVYNPIVPTLQPTPIPPSGPKLVKISELGAWMSANGKMDLKVPCPYAPLSGVVSVDSTLSIDFETISGLVMMYEKASCDRTGGLLVTTYDPGHPTEQVMFGTIWLYPMTGKLPSPPTATPGATVTLPPDGSPISLADLLVYMDVVGQQQTEVVCGATSISGWPSAVPVRVSVVTYLVDFTPIAGQVDPLLCGYVPNPFKMGPQKILIQRLDPAATQPGPWFQWNGWFFSPFNQ